MSYITRKLILLLICYKHFCTKHAWQWTGTYVYNLSWQKIINIFSAVQNERDRISSRRPSYEEQASGNGLSCASLLNAEMLSRQVGAALEVWKYFEHRCHIKLDPNLHIRSHQDTYWYHLSAGTVCIWKKR